MTQIDAVFDSRSFVAAWVSDPAGDWAAHSLAA
jgi:hypothetical protein